MKHKRLIFAWLVSMIAPLAWSHHSTAGYDEQKAMTVTGTVKKFYWTNPHMFIYLLVPNADGGTTEWVMEVGSPSINARNGWKSTDVKAGEKITVEFHPSRDGRPDGFAMIVHLANGKKRYCPGNDAASFSAPPI